MSKVLVTGGGGFIGTNLIFSLVQSGFIVTLYDNYSTPHSNYIHGSIQGLQNIRIIVDDLLDFTAIESAVEGQDYIVHLAAQKSIDDSIKDPVNSTKQNVLGMVNMLYAAKKYNVKRVIFASTAAVYGYNDHFPLSESEVLDPRSPYALEKIVGEQYLKLFYNLYGLQSVSLRIFNVYGPYQYSEKPHCGGVTIVMHQLNKDQRSIIFEDGSMTRDMIYVGDVVSAIIKVIESEREFKGDIYNVCTGKKNINDRNA